MLVASAVLFGAIAGGVVVHRLESTTSTSSTHEQSTNQDESGDGQPKHKPTKPAHPSPEPEYGQDKDT